MRKRRPDISLCLALILGSPCLLASAEDFPVPFTDEAVSRGILYLVAQGWFEGEGSFGCGMVLTDLDGDQRPDFLCTGAIDGAIGLFRNMGDGQFSVVEDNPFRPSLAASGVTAADYDGDGDMDIHFTSWLQSDLLYRNDGDMQFTDVTNESGMSNSMGAGTGASWADFDKDGDLDLYVANRTGSLGSQVRNQFWRNNGDGTFTDIAAAMEVDDEFATIQPVWLDYDDDGNMDLYLSTDKGGSGEARNRLYRNIFGMRFDDVSDESGTGVGIDSMGVAVGDIDGNGWLDIYCTNIPSGNPLLMNQGNGVFRDESKERGTLSHSTGWGTHFFDFDNDADLDLYVCNMTDGYGMNRLYRSENSSVLEDVAIYCNAQCIGDSYCMAVGDVDDDGDLDMFVQNHDQMIRLLINHEGERRNWVQFNLRGTSSNLNAIGSRMRARVGTNMLMRDVMAGKSYKSSMDSREHFGLGDADSMDELQVRFPDLSIRDFTNIPANRTWDLIHSDRMGDVDGNGTVDPSDLAAFPKVFGTGTIETGDEPLDFTGDFTIEDEDITLFLERYDGPIEDCDANGIVDAMQIARGQAPDTDLDGSIDDCHVPGDITGDGRVDGADLNALLGSWGTSWADADFNADGIIDGSDLLFLISNWSA